MQTEKCNLIAEKAIEMIEEVLSVSLNPEQRDLVNKLEKNQDLFHESIYRIEGKRKELIVALESIYYLFFYDFENKTERNSIDETLMVKLQQSLSTIVDSVETQKSEVDFHLLKFLENK